MIERFVVRADGLTPLEQFDGLLCPDGPMAQQTAGKVQFHTVKYVLRQQVSTILSSLPV